MSFEIAEASPADIPAWSESVFDASVTPHKPILCVYVPQEIDCPPEERRKRRIELVEQRCNESLFHIPEAVQLKAVDKETGQIIGGALYLLHEENPFKDYQPPTAPWQPEGPQREYAAKVLQVQDEYRKERMSQPHAFMSIMWASEHHRRKGVCRKMMKHMTDVADAKGMPSWLNASKIGRSAYRTMGFVDLDPLSIHARTDDPEIARSKEWRAMEDETAGCYSYPMFRPVGGRSDGIVV